MGRFSRLETQHAKAFQAEPAEIKPGKYGAEPPTYEGVMREAHDHFYRGEWKRALQLYSRALEHDNTRPEPWVGQVLALLFQSRCARRRSGRSARWSVSPNTPLRFPSTL